MLSRQAVKSGEGPIWGLLLPGFVLFCLALWPLRLAAAEAMVGAFCHRSGLSCEVSVASLGVAGARLEGPRISDEGGAGPIVSVDRLSLRTGWEDGLPRLSALSATGVFLRADLTGAGPVLGQLDPWLRRLAEAPRRPGAGPDVRLSGVSADIRTIAGPVKLSGDVRVFPNGTVHADLAGSAETLEAPGTGLVVRMAGFTAEARLAGGDLAIEGEGRTEGVEAGGFALRNAKADFRAEAVLSGSGLAGPGVPSASLVGIDLQIAAPVVQGPGVSGQDIAARLTLAKSGDGLAGAGEVSLARLQAGPANAAGLRLRGDVRMSAGGREMALQGETAVEGLRPGWAPPEPAAGAGEAYFPGLAAALDDIGGEFSGVLPVRIEASPEGARLVLTAPGSVRAGGWTARISGAAASFVRDGAAPAGRFSLSGEITAVHAAGGRLELALDDLVAGAAGLSARGALEMRLGRPPATSMLRLSRVRVSGADSRDWEASGDLSVESDIAADGIEVSAARLAAKPKARLVNGELTVDLSGSARLSWSGLGFGPLRIEAGSIAADLERPAGLSGRGRAGVAVRLAPVRLSGTFAAAPFSLGGDTVAARLSGRGGARLDLSGAGLRVSSGDFARLEAPRFSASLGFLPEGVSVAAPLDGFSVRVSDVVAGLSTARSPRS